MKRALSNPSLMRKLDHQRRRLRREECKFIPIPPSEITEDFVESWEKLESMVLASFGVLREVFRAYPYTVFGAVTESSESDKQA